MATLPRYERKGAGLIEQIGVVRQPRERGLGDDGSAEAASVVAGVLRRAATSLGDEAESIAVADATEAGQDAGVQRAPDGTPTFRPVDNSTPARRAYNRAGIVSYAAEQQNAARRSAVDLRAQAQEDPDRFEALWTGHTEGVLSGVPQELRTTVQHTLASVGGEHRNAMVDDRRRRQFAVAMQTTTEQLQRDEAEAASLALAGQRDSQRFRETVNRYNSTLTAAQASGMFSPEQAQMRRDRLAFTSTAYEGARTANGIRSAVDGLPGDAFERALGGRETGGRAGIVNPQGFAGRFQFGAARLAELGFYQPATGEDLNANQWRGTFSIPGHEGVRTLTDFLGSADAQRAAFGSHTADIDRQLAPVLAAHAGQTIAGVPITRDALRGMAHLGGVGGARRFVESGGTHNPADSNGTRLSDYGREFSQVAQSDATVGERAANRWIQRNIVEAAMPGVTPEQHIHMGNLARASVHDQAVTVRLDGDALARDMQATRDTLTGGGAVPVPEIEALERRAQTSGEPRHIQAARELRRDQEALEGFTRLPLSQQAEQIAQLRSAYDALPEGTSPAERERLNERINRLAVSHAAHRQQLDRDPAAMALRQPRVAEAFQEADRLSRAGDPTTTGAPAALQSAIQMSMDWQRSAGVPEARIAPLPTDQVQAIALRFANAPTARDRLGVLMQLEVDDVTTRDMVRAQLAGQGPDGVRIPREIAAILDVASNPARRLQAENLLSAIMVPTRDLNAWQAGDRQTAETQLNSTYDGEGGWRQRMGAAVGVSDPAPGIGRVLQRAAAATGDGRYGQMRDQYRDTILNVARVRSAPGDLAAGVDRAQADLFGHLGTLSHDGFAHVWYESAGVNRDRLVAGMRALRETEANRLAMVSRPTDEAGREAQRRFDAVIGDLRSGGTWVNDGALYSLVLPQDGRSVARYSLADILLAANRAAREGASDPLP